MRSTPSSRIVAALLGIAAVGIVGFSRGQSPPYHVERLGDSVFAILRHDPEAMANNSNSLVVVGGDGVLVVDAQFTRLATLQTLAAIRQITRKPVRYVVNTHWHDDHTAGNQVYRDTFPAVQFVSHINTRTDLATKGAANRKDNVTGGEAYVSRLERLMRMGLGFDSTALAPTEAAALQSTITIMRQYIAEAPGFREVLPEIGFGNRLSLFLGTREVQLRYFGPANTDGDAVVVVPDARVVATGDLVVFPIPFAFNSHIASWIPALDSLRQLRPAVFMPGHGPLLRDDAYIAEVQRLLARIRDETRGAVARGDSLPAIRRRVTLADEKSSLAGDDKWKRIMFDYFFVRPAVVQAFGEASHR